MNRATKPFDSGDETEVYHKTPAQGIAQDPFPGEFRLLRELGSGAFGSVWLAEDLSPLGRLVALKFVLLGARRPEVALAALRREAKLLASLSHPHIVQVYAWKMPETIDCPCLVLQYVSGGSLKDLVGRDGPLHWMIAGRYTADVADGLAALHERGVIHRDVKPANMLHETQTDEALLTDLGVAARLTEQADIGGTAHFMAPEAFAGEVSPAIDVYSLAGSLFWLSIGTHAFDGATREELLTVARQGLSLSDSRLGVMPQSLEELIRAGLAPSPSERPTLTEFRLGLRAALNRHLADRFSVAPEGETRLTLTVLRRNGLGEYLPVAVSRVPGDEIARDPGRVPNLPDRVTLFTGERVRVEVMVAKPGYLSLFNIGPTGRLNWLYPQRSGEGKRVEANQPLCAAEVELMPPTGRERLVALWTKEPWTEGVHHSMSATADREGEYQSSRHIKKLQEAFERIAESDRAAVVLELEHRL